MSSRIDNQKDISVVIDPGTYVVAVSGGVDSMVLLDILHQQPLVRLIVAHYDHGIRQDSDLDRQIVQREARKRGLQFVYDEAKLGPITSEAKAREARYGFLHKIRQASGAKAIITAHHQDDLLETAIINLLRGTGRRGLSSLRSKDTILRPLLHVSKQEIRGYAVSRQLTWREDETNLDTRYLRNYVRHKIVSKLTKANRAKLLQIILQMHVMNDEIDMHLTNHLHMHAGLKELDRHTFIMLPHCVAQEVMLAWLKKHYIADVDRKTIDRLIIAAKTYKPSKSADIDKNHQMIVTGTKISLQPSEA
jgi:tRNA(Ile)-lysidine synthetase-like protein